MNTEEMETAVSGAAAPEAPSEVIVVELPSPVDVTLVDQAEPIAVTLVDHRPFLSTPLDDYTVTEGLLLLIGVILFLNMLARALKEGFSWLT